LTKNRLTKVTGQHFDSGKYNHRDDKERSEAQAKPLKHSLYYRMQKTTPLLVELMQVVIEIARQKLDTIYRKEALGKSPVLSEDMARYD
jgi:hypothetical protein